MRADMDVKQGGFTPASIAVRISVNLPWGRYRHNRKLYRISTKQNYREPSSYLPVNHCKRMTETRRLKESNVTDFYGTILVYLSDG